LNEPGSPEYRNDDRKQPQIWQPKPRRNSEPAGGDDFFSPEFPGEPPSPARGSEDFSPRNADEDAAEEEAPQKPSV
ncbi:MAG: hypothetical protein KDA58_16100, partial [Planctomycetaceae bacterium]|nr:hypothetical protein [Planctomycetaceae bacterium]